MIKLKQLKKQRRIYLFYILLFGVGLFLLGAFLALGVSPSFLSKAVHTTLFPALMEYLQTDGLRYFITGLGLLFLGTGAYIIRYFCKRISYLNAYEMSTITMDQAFDLLYPGRVYHVIKEFTDFKGDLHSVGEEWVLTKITWYPHESMFTLYADRKVYIEAIPLKLAKGYQGIVVNYIYEYIVEKDLLKENPPA